MEAPKGSTDGIIKFIDLVFFVFQKAVNPDTQGGGGTGDDDGCPTAKTDPHGRYATRPEGTSGSDPLDGNPVGGSGQYPFAGGEGSGSGDAFARSALTCNQGSRGSPGGGPFADGGFGGNRLGCLDSFGDFQFNPGGGGAPSAGAAAPLAGRTVALATPAPLVAPAVFPATVFAAPSGASNSIPGVPGEGLTAGSG